MTAPTPEPSDRLAGTPAATDGPETLGWPGLHNPGQPPGGASDDVGPNIATRPSKKKARGKKT
jgi:hypothetical protein